MNLIVSDLSPNTDTKDLQKLFEKYGKVRGVTLHNEGDPDRLTCVVNMDEDHKTLQHIADKLNNTTWKEQKLQVDAPLFFSR